MGGKGWGFDVCAGNLVIGPICTAMGDPRDGEGSSFEGDCQGQTSTAIGDAVLFYKA